MNKENTPKKTRQRTLVFVAMFAGFLGTSIFAGVNVFTAYQKNQDFSQLEAEEKFSRLPQYLLTDHKLLNDQDPTVRSSAAKALSKLQSKESIPRLTELLKDSSESVRFQVVVALSELQSKESIPRLTELLKDSSELVRFQVVVALSELQSKESIPRLTELLKDSSELVRLIAKRALKELRSKRNISPSLIKSSGYSKKNPIFFDSVDETSHAVDRFIEKHISMPDYQRHDNLQTLAISDIKKVLPKLMSAFNKSNGVEQYKMIEALIILDGLNESQIREVILGNIKELEEFNELSDPEKKSLTINILVETYLKYNQRFKELVSKQPSINQSRQIRDRQWLLTGSASATSLLLLLLMLFSLRQIQRISWNDHLICYFPEEVVGELIALRRELTQANKSKILIETKLLYEIFTLVWGFYIQINIDNLSLPSKDQRRR